MAVIAFLAVPHGEGATAHASVAPAVVVRGVVAADGRPRGIAAGWTVERVDIGHYVLHVEDSSAPPPVVLRWDAPAMVHILPSRDGTEITFSEAGRPIDTRFIFQLG